MMNHGFMARSLKTVDINGERGKERLGSRIAQSRLFAPTFRWLKKVVTYPALAPSNIHQIVTESLRGYVSWQRPNGGWAADPRSRASGPWSTAQAIYLLLDIDNTTYKDSIEKALSWLMTQRNRDGGWGMEPRVSDVTGTELAIYALAKAGHAEHRAALGKAADWLVDKQNADDNGWAFVPRNTVSSVYCTTWAMISLLAAAEALNRPIISKVHVLRGKKFLLDAQRAERADPGWGKFLKSPTEGMRTAYALNGLLAVKSQRSKSFRHGLRALRKEQLADGGWGDDEGSNVEGTTWGIIAMLRSGHSPFSRSVNRAVSFLLKAKIDGTYTWPERVGGPAQVWCTHHAILALNTYLLALQPLTRGPLYRIAGMRVHLRLLSVIKSLSYYWIFLGASVIGVLLALLVSLGVYGTQPVIYYFSQHGAFIGTVAAVLTIANIIAVTLKGIFGKSG
jgi:prenyltransferase beta subunit